MPDFVPSIFCWFFFSSAKTISQRSRKAVIIGIVWQEQWFMSNCMQKNICQSIHLCWSDQVLMIRAEWAAERGMHWKAELCFELALGADISQRVVWKWLLAAILHTLPPYEVFWGDLWFRSVSRGVSTAPHAEAVTVLKQVNPVHCLHVLARKDVRNPRNPRNPGIWNCNAFMSRMKLDRRKKPMGYGGKRCCDLCSLSTQQLNGSGYLRSSCVEGRVGNWTRTTPLPFLYTYL